MLSVNSIVKVIWREARVAIDPVGLLAPPDPHSAVLCWGKAALRQWEVLAAQQKQLAPVLVVAPEGSVVAPRLRGSGARIVLGEHPLPGAGSFAAGAAIVDFFDAVARMRARSIQVYLSGGASSLAWIKPAEISEDFLLRQLADLYAKPLTIDQLNLRRSKLCRLKGGGAARWARVIAGTLPIRVDVISDVAPLGPQVIGSGPFWDGRIPHRVLADNATLVEAAERVARRLGVSILESNHSQLIDWRKWVGRTLDAVRAAKIKGQSGVILLGGEPHLRLDSNCRGRGGRQTHIALALAIELRSEIESGKVEIMCTSSDGVDGRSGASGAYLGPRQASRIELLLETAKRDLSAYNSASVLKKIGALIPAQHSGTNVQDILIVSVRN